ncbi:MAG: hypothetical protein EPN61_17530 [Burkholderiaceae bacterium]|nr:MAG: hypothetical protein EPN61_17530 [Burkholderiaceae bacterium]
MNLPNLPGYTDLSGLPDDACDTLNGEHVQLTDGYGFLDKGDKGRVLFIDGYSRLAWVALDGGAAKFVPLRVLALYDREFRIQYRDSLSRDSYRTEDAAVDAAEGRGLSAFNVVEVKHVASYTVLERYGSDTPATR